MSPVYHLNAWRYLAVWFCCCWFWQLALVATGANGSQPTCIQARIAKRLAIRFVRRLYRLARVVLLGKGLATALKLTATCRSHLTTLFSPSSLKNLVFWARQF